VSSGVPEPLLHPLLDSAGDVLRQLEPEEVPVVLRAITGFDRRGMARGPARQQLRRALEIDEEFRNRAVEHFLARPEARVMLEQWDPKACGELIAGADERGDLPLLASVLYADRPDGWAFGLGAACGTYTRGRRDEDENADQHALQVRIDELQEACRRAEQHRSESAALASRLDAELREERRSRRAREVEAERRVAEADRQVEEREQAAEVARRQSDAAQGRLQASSERTRALQEELRAARAKLTTAREAQRVATASGLRPQDLQALADAASLARRLADGLGGVVAHARAKGALEREPTDTAPAEHAKPPRRAEVPVPAGLVADTPDAVARMMRHPGVAIVLDGYNVSMAAWPEAEVADQRERLVSLLAEVALRTRAPVTVVFDGADVGPVTAVRRPGVRVVFSEPGEKADPVVVREVAALPRPTPVLVVSSDQWVRTHAEHEGARAVSSRAFLGALRR
jgi:predicted RNA-binding protein with PIN domain